jgi:hypothetical protein
MYEENMKENTKHRDRKNKTQTRKVEKQEENKHSILRNCHFHLRTPNYFGL